LANITKQPKNSKKEDFVDELKFDKVFLLLTYTASSDIIDMLKFMLEKG
jgi:hypothetical protein